MSNNATREQTPAPRWLADEPLIQQILHRFLDRLDKHPDEASAKLQAITLNERDFPALFQPRGDDDPERTWDCIRELERLCILRLQLSRAIRNHDPEYKGAKTNLTRAGIAMVRVWFQRPHPEPGKADWVARVDQFTEHFPGSVMLLRDSRWSAMAMGPERFLQGLVDVGRLLDHSLYQTQISAHCFQGDSKFLHGKEELLASLYPGYLDQIKQRPVLLQVALCDQPQGVLFIENEDCFLQAADGFYPGTEHLVLVYSAGFRGSAERICRRDGARISYLIDSSSRCLFERHWFGETEDTWSWFFWGDLDFSGMGILAALRRQFPQVSAWRQGYVPLLNRLSQGHEFSGGNKERQIDPGMTGCIYADQQLLPALRTQGRGMDQESWVPRLDSERTAI